MQRQKPNWHLYILLCDNGAYYTGITTDLQRRFEQHSSGKGAKYTRGNRGREIVYIQNFRNRSSASKAEAAIKKLTHSQKEKLCKQF